MTRLSRAASWPSPWPLLLGLCFITWLIGLALALPYGVDGAVRHWEGELNDHVMIALPPAGNSRTADPAGDLLPSLRAAFPNLQVTRLPERDVERSLAAWSPPWEGPLPALVSLTHHDGDMADLTSFVHQHAPEAIVIPPPPQLTKLAPLMKSLRHAASTASLAAGFAAALVIPALLHLGARTIALANTGQLALLPALGGRTSSLHHILARRMALMVFSGSLAGIVLLVPSLVFIASALRPLLRMPPFSGIIPALYPQSFLPPTLWGLFILTPCLMALLGWGMVHLVCRRQERRPS